jgi:hypothetical protein
MGTCDLCSSSLTENMYIQVKTYQNYFQMACCFFKVTNVVESLTDAGIQKDITRITLVKNMVRAVTAAPEVDEIAKYFLLFNIYHI